MSYRRIVMTHISAVFFSALLLLVVFAAAGCGGSSDSMDATTADVDENTPIEITDDEYAAFNEPADSILSEKQVEAFLKTSLLQFDLVREHGARMHERVAEMEERASQGGALAGLRNLVDAGRTAMEFGDLIGGSFIRSARTLGYNPAELEWVRERMAEAAALATFAPLQASMAEGAREARAQLEAMRTDLQSSEGGYSEADLQETLDQLDAFEQEAGQATSDAVGRNLEMLRSTRPNVTDEMWGVIGLSAGPLGLMGLSGLADPNSQEAQDKLDELRTLYTDALENRTSPGMGH